MNKTLSSPNTVNKILQPFFYVRKQVSYESSNIYITLWEKKKKKGLPFANETVKGTPTPQN